MRHIAASALALAHVAMASPALAEKALPMTIGGRVAPVSGNPAHGYTHQWPGTYFEGRFRGTHVAVRLKDEINILDIYIDGKLADTETKPGEGQIEFGPLPDVEHTIRVEKRTEAFWSAAQFTGLFVPDTAEVLMPVKRARQIEFIGDSYTVGYGNTSAKRECPGDQVWATTNTQRAFGPLTAKHFNADYRINAISGRGIVRNYNGGEGDHLPQAYPYAVKVNGIPASPDSNPAGDSWAPQVIVIGLGTNDFSTPLNPGEQWKTRDELHADYEAGYVAFVQSLRSQNPDAFFVLMATDQVNGEIQSEVKKVMAALQSGGESRIAFIAMNGLSFSGCDWHPSTDDDRKVADSITAFLDSRPELWQGK